MWTSIEFLSEQNSKSNRRYTENLFFLYYLWGLGMETSTLLFRKEGRGERERGEGEEKGIRLLTCVGNLAKQCHGFLLTVETLNNTRVLSFIRTTHIADNQGSVAISNADPRAILHLLVSTIPNKDERTNSDAFAPKCCLSTKFEFVICWFKGYNRTS